MAEVNVIFEERAVQNPKGKLTDENKLFQRKSEDGGSTEVMLRKMNVPGDGSCLFWAVTMAYLLPVRNNQVIFGERFKRLFGLTDLKQTSHVQKLFLKYNFDFVYEDRVLIELVTNALRNRVVNEVMKQETEVCQSITLNDFLHIKNEAFITDGTFAQLFQKELPSEIHLIDLTQLKPNILNDETIELMNTELDKISNKKKIQKFKFHCYLQSMRSCKSWAGELEIQATQRLLQCQILIFANENDNFTINDNVINICLFNNNEVHFEFGLVKAEYVIEAIKNKNYQLAIDYIDVGVDKIDFQDDNGDSLLHFAALSDDKNDLIKKLINQGADLNIRNKNNKTPSDVANDLHLEKSKEMFDLNPELVIAEQRKHSFSFIVNNLNCNLNEQRTPINILIILYDENGHSQLQMAAAEGNLSLVQLILSISGQHPHSVLEVKSDNGKGQTALHLAVLNNHLKVVKCLIEAGADVNAKDNELVSVLTYAVRAGFNLIVQYLIEKGAEINSVDQHGMTPVHHAIKCNQWDTVQCLVENNADLNIADENNVTPLSRVLKVENWDMVRCLLENGALLSGLTNEIKNDIFKHFIPENSVENQLYQAVKLGNVEVLETLFEKHKINNNEILYEILANVYDD